MSACQKGGSRYRKGWTGILLTIANYRWNYSLRNDHGIFDFNYSNISAVYDI